MFGGLADATTCILSPLFGAMAMYPILSNTYAELNKSTCPFYIEETQGPETESNTQSGPETESSRQSGPETESCRQFGPDTESSRQFGPETESCRQSGSDTESSR